MAEFDVPTTRSPDPYVAGVYFVDPGRHGEDGPFKAREFLHLLTDVAAAGLPVSIRSYADVGCGSGEAVSRVAAGLRDLGHPLQHVSAYDVSPHVRELHCHGVEYVHGDFASCSESVDLVTLFDVLEHIPDPIGFLKHVGARTRLLGIHLPLEYSWMDRMRGTSRKRLADPGHLLQLDEGWAINLMALGGLRILDYRITRTFTAPSGHTSVASRMMWPARWLLAQIRPQLCSVILGGTGIMILASSPVKE